MSESLHGKGFTSKIESAPAESQMIINPLGARIERLRLGRWTILRSVIRGDGKTASSHPCTPIFGPETNTDFGLPQHGPMRNNMSKVLEEGSDRVVLRYNIESGSYPLGISVRQVFALQDGGFVLETSHVNNGSQAVPVNFGEHFYWAAPRGYEGVTINGEDMTYAIQNDLVVPLNPSNRIAIPGMPEITFEQQGLPYANLWVFRGEASGEARGRYDRNYVCIEPVEGDPTKDFFGSKESLIQPGHSRTTLIKISTQNS